MFDNAPVWEPRGERRRLARENIFLDDNLGVVSASPVFHLHACCLTEALGLRTEVVTLGVRVFTGMWSCLPHDLHPFSGYYRPDAPASSQVYFSRPWPNGARKDSLGDSSHLAALVFTGAPVLPYLLPVGHVVANLHTPCLAEAAGPPKTSPRKPRQCRHAAARGARSNPFPRRPGTRSANVGA